MDICQSHCVGDWVRTAGQLGLHSVTNWKLSSLKKKKKSKAGCGGTHIGPSRGRYRSEFMNYVYICLSVHTSAGAAEWRGEQGIPCNGASRWPWASVWVLGTNPSVSASAVTESPLHPLNRFFQLFWEISDRWLFIHNCWLKTFLSPLPLILCVVVY